MGDHRRSRLESETRVSTFDNNDDFLFFIFVYLFFLKKTKDMSEYPFCFTDLGQWIGTIRILGFGMEFDGNWVRAGFWA